MVPLPKIAAVHVTLPAAADIIQMAPDVLLMNVQMVRPNVQTAEQRARNRPAAVVFGAARAIVQAVIRVTARVPIAAAV